MHKKSIATLAIVVLIMQNSLTTTVQAQPIVRSEEIVGTVSGCSYPAISSAEEPSVSKTSDAAQIEKQTAAKRHTVQRVGAALGLYMTASQWSSWASVLAPSVLRVLPFLPHSLASAMGLAPVLVGSFLLGQIVYSSTSTIIYILSAPEEDALYETGSGSEQVQKHLSGFNFFLNHLRENSDFLWPTGLTEGWTIKNFLENIGCLSSSYVSTITGVMLVRHFLTSSIMMAETAAEDARLLVLYQQIWLSPLPG